MNGQGIDQKRHIQKPKKPTEEKNASPNTPLPNDEIPEKVGPYRIEKRLGVGGMGQVYQAFDERLQRRVAVKQILPGETPDARARERLRREARAVASLNHPAIVQIHDILEEAEGDWIIMELVEGRTLHELSAEGFLSLRDVVKLACEIAEGLAQAHEKGIVHRDLKTENIMVTPDGHAKILDFGLAKRLWHHRKNEVSLSVQGSLLGTGRAMSPEQVLGEEVDHRSDLFSLGTLLYESVTGKRPFQGMSLIMTLAQVCTEQQAPPIEVNPEVPQALSDLIEKLLEKEPPDRPTGAAEVAEILHEISANLPEDLRAPGTYLASQGTQSVSDLRKHLEAAARKKEKPAPEPTTGIFVKTLLQLSVLDARHLSEQLGNTRAYEVLSRHDQLARNLLIRYEGLEVNKADGFLLLFHRAIDALRYALDYFEESDRFSRTQGVDFKARVGIHLGEVFLRENGPEEVHRGARPLEVEGDAKEIVGQIVHLAQGGRILLTQAAYEMAKKALTETDLGSGSWVDHGEYSLDGLEERVHLHELTRHLGQVKRPSHKPSLAKTPYAQPVRPRKRRLLIATAAVALTTCLLLLWIGTSDFFLSTFFPSKSPGGSTVSTPKESAEGNAELSSRPALAILGFKNLGSSAEADWLSTALAELFSVELGASEDVRIIPGENIARMKLEVPIESTESLAPDTLQRIGDYLGARYVILGSYLSIEQSADRRLRLTVRIQDTQNGENIGYIQQTGAEVDLLELVTESSSQLRERLGIGAISVDEAAAVRATVSENPDAIKLYAEGLDQLLRFDALGATKRLEEAIREDPQYALAHAALSQAWRLLGHESRARDSALEAMKLSEGLPRESVLRIEASLHEASGSWDEAIRTYEGLWAFYPDNIEYGLRLAEAQILAERGEEALKTVQKMRRLPEPTNEDLRIDLAESLANGLRRDHPAAVVAAQKAAQKGKSQNLPTLVAEAQRLQARGLYFQGQFDQALPLLEEAAERFSQVGLTSRIAVVAGNTAEILYDQRLYSRAYDEFRTTIAQYEVLGNRAIIAGYQRRIAMIHLVRGEISDAEREILEALDIARETGSRVREARCLETLTMVRIQQGRLPEAEKLGQEVVALGLQSNNANRLGWGYLALSEVARLRGKLDRTKLFQLQSLKAAGEVGQRIMQMKLELHYFVDAAFLSWAKDEPEEVLRNAERFSAMLQDLGPRSEPVQSRTILLRVLADMGETRQALALAESWIEEMRAAGAADTERLLQAAVAEIETRQGRPAEAGRRLEVVPGTSESPWVILKIQWVRALIQHAEGDPDGAVTALERIAEQAAERQYFVLARHAHLQKAIFLLDTDRREEARDMLENLRRESLESSFSRTARVIDQLLTDSAVAE